MFKGLSDVVGGSRWLRDISSPKAQGPPFTESIHGYLLTHVGLFSGPAVEAASRSTYDLCPSLLAISLTPTFALNISI